MYSYHIHCLCTYECKIHLLVDCSEKMLINVNTFLRYANLLPRMIIIPGENYYHLKFIYVSSNCACWFVAFETCINSFCNQNDNLLKLKSRRSCIRLSERAEFLAKQRKENTFQIGVSENLTVDQSKIVLLMVK